jgi:hypothetical protein
MGGHALSTTAAAAHDEDLLDLAMIYEYLP